MPVSEALMYEGRTLTISWRDNQTLPPRELITQASGICFTDEGEIVLVASKDGHWSLPGGHLEPGEDAQQALVREVWEEACAVVESMAYLGAQQVDDPGEPGGLTRYYQTRFWARVRLEPFRPQFETYQRITITPTAFLHTLQWSTTRVAQAMLEAALAQEQRFLVRS